MLINKPNFKYTDSETKKYLSQLRESKGWEILNFCFSIRREGIIEKGKKMRSEEGKIKIWAELDGFDKAVNLLNEILKENIKEIKTNAEEE